VPDWETLREEQYYGVCCWTNSEAALRTGTQSLFKGHVWLLRNRKLGSLKEAHFART
jgi:hypothetical protein